MDEYKEKEFTLKNRHGQSIIGILCHSRTTTTRWLGEEKDVILLNHGFLGDRNAFFFKDLARYLLPFTTFRFDLPLFLADGQTFRFAAFQEDLNDMVEVMDCLHGHGYRVIGLVGHSRGASESVCFGGLYQPRFLSFIVSISARYFMRLPLPSFSAEQAKEMETKKSILLPFNVRGERKKLQITKAMIDEFEIELSEQYAKLVPKSLPVLLIHGTADKIISHRHSLAYHDAVPNATLILVQGADHLFSKPFDTVMFQEVKKYIIEKTIFRPVMSKM